MCHDWWTYRATEDAEARRMWEEFERTPPAREPEAPADEPEVILEERERTSAGAER
jgi:hypothetical protein